MTVRVGTSRTRHEVKSAIEQELATLLDSRVRVAQRYGTAFTRLWLLAAEHIRGGKLVRPVLVVEAAHALRDPLSSDDAFDAQLIRLAAAVEVLHYAFLLHDDVIDGDVTRRGRSNLIGSLLADAQAHLAPDEHPGERGACATAAHWARTGGILMGDLMLSLAHQIFARASLSEVSRGYLLDLLDHTIVESVAGEQVDVGLADGLVAPDLTTILDMSAHKTATYSFELPLRVAALLAGADQRVHASLARAGRHLGLAFQLQDDLIAVFGDPTRHGKDGFSDLREGKQTPLIAYARMTSAWHRIEPSFGRGALSPRDALRMREELRECGAKDYVEALIADELRAFRALLDDPAAAIPPRLRGTLAGLADGLEGRGA